MVGEIIFKTKILGKLFSKLVSRLIVGFCIGSLVLMVLIRLFYSYLVGILPESLIVTLGLVSGGVFFCITTLALFQRDKKNFIGTLVLTNKEILIQSKDMDSVKRMLEKGDKIKVSYKGFYRESSGDDRHTGQRNWLYFDPSDDTKRIEFYIDTKKHKNQLIRVLEAWYERGIEVEETKGGVKSYLLEVPKKSMLSVFKKGKDK